MPTDPRAVAVFCGSRPGARPEFAAAARALGRGVAESGMTLVYGGGGVGLMGMLAESAVEARGRVIGVIPEFLTRLERPSPVVVELEIVESMHARKRRMFELADAFVTLPGGLGTLDETVEILTWRQLRLHDKPLFAIDVNGWATRLERLVRGLVEDGFVAAEHAAMLTVVPDVPAALERLQGVANRPVEPAPRL